MLPNTFEPASMLLNIFRVVLCRQPSVSDVQINKNLSKGPRTQHGAEGSGERSSPLYFRQHIPMNTLAVPSAPLAPCWTRSQYVLLMIQRICLQSSRGTHTVQTQPRCQNPLPRAVLWELRRRSCAVGLCNAISLDTWDQRGLCYVR